MKVLLRCMIAAAVYASANALQQKASKHIGDDPTPEEVCDSCKTFYEDLKFVLQEEQTKDALSMRADELICSKIENERLKGVCSSVVEVFVHVIAELIAKQIDPDVICGPLCPSGEDSNVMKPAASKVGDVMKMFTGKL